MEATTRPIRILSDVPEAARRPHERPRILVVDDEPLITAACARLLRRDHDVIALADSRLALVVALTEHFDVIICDLRMPHVSGRELFERVCARRPDAAVRFLFMSGNSDDAHGDDVFDRLASRALVKPFGREDLLAEVHARLGR